MSADIRLKSLIILQYIVFGFIIFTGPLFANNVFFLLIESIGIAILLWTSATLKSSTFTIVTRSSTLITSGPYASIRHPMHLSILLMSLALLLDMYTINRLFAYIILIGITHVTMDTEEMLLSSHHKAYSHYRKSTKKIIPYLY